MTVDDWPILCEHTECKGTATPAEWILFADNFPPRHLCQKHTHRAYNQGFNKPEQWVKLTPNQRPSPVQEVQSGSHDQG